ncbi:Multidrug resistance protein Stp [Mycobacterium innocens]|uniref:Multidrug resistance protein Stp n=2 Tax=Mycobacterium innocens TaxID=2341083 RepID=A0A498Q4R6_9MYCO|nr:Multidrug resistance protein Stp [Mycobacterium innocens]
MTVAQVSHRAMTPRQRLTVVATGLGIFMVFVDVNIVNVALPSIQAVYKTGEQGLQWAVAGYSLGMAAVLMSCALIGDRYGRRRGFFVGLGVFAAASLICAVPVSLGILTVARIVQGVGAAFISVLSLALLSHTFPDPGMKARAIAGWMAIGCIGAGSAPALGGVLVEGLGWRSVFAVNVPLGAIVWLLTALSVTESKDPDPTQLDWPGQLLFAPAIAVIAYAIIEAPRVDRQPGLIVTLLLVATALLLFFVQHERRAAFPLIDLHLFTDPVYRSALVVYFVVMSCYFGTLMVITQHFQNVRGFSPLHAGLLMLPVPVGFGIASLLAGRAVERWGPRLPLLICLTAMIAGLMLFGMAIGRVMPVVITGLALFGAGAGGCATPLLSIGMTEVDDHRAGMAAGLINLQRSLGSIFGVALLGSILAGWLSATLPERLDTVISEPGERAAVLSSVVDGANPRAHAADIGPGHPMTSAQEQLVVRVADKEFIRGVQLAVAGAAVLLLGALALGLRRFPTGLPTAPQRD